MLLEILEYLDQNPESLVLLSVVLGSILAGIWKKVRSLVPGEDQLEKHLAGIVAAGLVYVVPKLLVILPSTEPVSWVPFFMGLFVAMTGAAGVYQAKKRITPN